jgi:ribosomal protein L11 methyltransferase
MDSGIKTLLIGERFAVFPFFEGRPREFEPGRLHIFIGPGKAFGSGEHETTASVLQEMEKMAGWGEARVLDIGCGTGVLSIAAARLGARDITAVDTEEDAVEACRRNIALNGVEGMVAVKQGDIGSVRGERYDIILANLYGDLLVEIADDAALLLKPQARLIISGISYEYAYEVKKAFTGLGLAVTRSRALENYCTFVLKKER